MKRTEARELLFTLLYEAQFSDPDNFDEIYRTELRCREIEDDEYVRRVFYGIGEKLSEIDDIIECHANGRLSKVTCAILRLCIYELKYEKDIPMNVSLNEAVELAKKYGEDKAAGFINGILNCIAHEIVTDD